MRSPLLRAISLASLAVLSLSACGDSNDETPAACLEGPTVFLRALADTPGEVRLRGDVPISDCLVANQKGGELATVGFAIVTAATRLNAEAQTDPDGPAPRRLGYLLGAAKRGAEETAGIHAELIRRLEAAATYSPQGQPLSPAFRRSYEEGRDAGLARG